MFSVPLFITYILRFIRKVIGPLWGIIPEISPVALSIREPAVIVSQSVIFSGGSRLGGTGSNSGGVSVVVVVPPLESGGRRKIIPIVKTTNAMSTIPMAVLCVCVLNYNPKRWHIFQAYEH